MKRMAFMLLYSIVLSAAIIAIPVADDQILVEFASVSQNIFGFSTETVTSLKEVETVFKDGEGTVSKPKEMSPDVSKGVYTTKPFHFYAQLFSSDAVTISLISNGPMKNENDDELDYNNVGRMTGKFTGSAEYSSPIVLVQEEPDSEELKYPRVYSYDFELQVPFESVVGKSGVYTSYITIEISGDEGGQG